MIVRFIFDGDGGLSLFMSLVETVAVFVGIPALVFAAVAGLVYLSGFRASRRYRPGRWFEFTPVWFVSSPDLITGTSGSEDRPAIMGGPASDPAGASGKGGARGSW